MARDSTASAAGRNLDRDTKTVMLTWLANNKHAFMDAAEAEKLAEKLAFRRRPNGSFYAYVKD